MYIHKYTCVIMYKYELAMSTNIQHDLIQKSPQKLLYCNKTHIDHFMNRYRQMNYKQSKQHTEKQCYNIIL